MPKTKRFCFFGLVVQGVVGVCVAAGLTLLCFAEH